MLNKNQFMFLTALAVLSLCLTLANMIIYGGNRSVQAEVSQRAQYIQQSLQLQNMYNALVRELAQLSVKNNDTQLRDLLASQGITYNANAGQKGQAKQNAPSQKKGGQK